MRGRIPGGGARLQQLMKTFDKNGDGKLDAEERAALMQYLRTIW
jgi:Ca2+-binding EF-hand superfamily protein